MRECVATQVLPCVLPWRVPRVCLSSNPSNDGYEEYMSRAQHPPNITNMLFFWPKAKGCVVPFSFHL